MPKLSNILNSATLASLLVLAPQTVMAQDAPSAEDGEQPDEEQHLYRVELLLFAPAEGRIDESTLEDMGGVAVPDWQTEAGPVIWGPDWDRTPEPGNMLQADPLEPPPEKGAGAGPEEEAASVDSPADNLVEAPPERELLPDNELKLQTARNRLIRSGRYEPLAMMGWKEAFPPGHQTPPLTVRIGDRYREHYEVEGTIQIKRRRYLHVKAELFDVSLPAEEQRQPLEPAWSPLRQPDASAEARSDVGSADPLAALEFDFATWQPEPQFGVVSWMRETRRMRSEELHYLDAPTLGLLVYFEPIEPEPEPEIEEGVSEEILPAEETGQTSQP